MCRSIASPTTAKAHVSKEARRGRRTDHQISRQIHNHGVISGDEAGGDGGATVEQQSNG